MMQAILAINGQLEQDTPRQIIAADSFQGIPAGVEPGVSMIDAIAQDTFTESDPSEFRKKDWLNRFVADESWLYENLRKLGLMKDTMPVVEQQQDMFAQKMLHRVPLLATKQYIYYTLNC